MQRTEDTQQSRPLEDAPFSIKKEIENLFRSILDIFIKYWRMLGVFAICGTILSIGYCFIKPVVYTSRITFVVEESKMGGGSIASALAGQFGVDLGSIAGSTSSGILAGDNVLELVKSHTLIRKTLLTSYDSTNPIYSLADKYAETIGWKKKWAKSDKVGKYIYFFSGSAKQGRTKDSLIQKIIKTIIKTNLQIIKPDRKLSFFELSVSTRDEQLSLLFSQRILKAATDFYINTKTSRLNANIKRLQNKADSLAISLNRKTYFTADAGKTLLDINPAYTEPEASVEISSRDQYMQATIYAEIIKNLEISKTALLQETPTIQIVDDPEIPLKDNKLNWWLAIFIGILVAVFIPVFFLIFFKE